MILTMMLTFHSSCRSCRCRRYRRQIQSVNAVSQPIDRMQLANSSFTWFKFNVQLLFHSVIGAQVNVFLLPKFINKLRVLGPHLLTAYLTPDDKQMRRPIGRFSHLKSQKPAVYCLPRWNTNVCTNDWTCVSGTWGSWPWRVGRNCDMPCEW